MTSFSELTNLALANELDKANMLLHKFTYACSHGLRSPLKTISGLINLIKSDPSPENHQAYLLLVREAIMNTQSIHAKFSVYLKHCGAPIRSEVINLEDFLQDVLLEYAKPLSKKSICTSILINQKGQFYSDKNRLHHVIQELVSNAISFSDESKQKRRLSFYVTASPSSCNIQLHDNGIGIPREEKQKVFDIFHRGSAISRGAGLGLYFAKQIVTELDGTINIYPQPDNLTIFSIWIPNA